MPLAIRPETPADHAAVQALHHAAFEGDQAVLDLVADLRRLHEPFPTVSLVAVNAQNHPLGHAMVSHAWLDTPTALTDIGVLSMLGVHPLAQSQGIGTALIAAAIAAANALSLPMLILEGDHRYYGPRGFSSALAADIRRPSLRIPEKAFQIAKLDCYDPALTGTFVYRDVNWRHGVGLYKNR